MGRFVVGDCPADGTLEFGSCEPVCNAGFVKHGEGPSCAVGVLTKVRRHASGPAYRNVPRVLYLASVC